MTDGNNPMQAIWVEWLALWNGDLAKADTIIAEDFRVHFSPLPGTPEGTGQGRAGLTAWIAGFHQTFVPFRFVEQFAPVIDRDMIAGRWRATGVLAGEFPGAQAARGTPVAFAGADFLRVAGGRIAEYWLASDMTDLLSQLEVEMRR